MAEAVYALYDERACLRVAGADRLSFLQGLISNDVGKIGGKAGGNIGNGRAIYAALLTGQGRMLHDLFLVAHPTDEAILIDAEAARLDDLKRRLQMYKLRAKVEIVDARAEYAVALAWGDGAAAKFGLASEPGDASTWGGGVAFVDPRLAALGCRAILPRASAAATLERAGLKAAPLAGHRRLRLALGVPEGSGDLPPEKALPMENGLDALNGVDFDKGCYVGQELTARMKHRALVKRRLVPVAIEGRAPALGTPILLGSDEVGELRAAEDGVGLALLKLEAIEAGLSLSAGAARVKALKPAWRDQDSQGSRG
ncbi:MAG TPA: folate-binding protein [Alphaproteobacteria bacterium]|nr:folate-binding protein [Alphaproteobacteria bacterium]